MTRHQRGSERGVVRVAATALLAAFGALLSVVGCSSDEGTGGEQLGTSQAALVCRVCPADTACATFKCNSVTGLCEAIMLLDSDGNRCLDAKGAKGSCTNGGCCTGCVEPVRGGGSPKCHPLGTEDNACGTSGVACNNCVADRCFKGGCNPQTFACEGTVLPDRETCTDGSSQCWKGVCCTGCLDRNGACVQNDVNNCGLSSANALVTCKDCDDGEFCTINACTAGSCATPVPRQNNLPCVDADKCDGDETCQSGKCTAGAPLVCNDTKVCTTDTCSAGAGGGCVFTNNSGSCADANKCNGTEVCANGACGVGTPLNCNDNNPCTVDTCDMAMGCKNVLAVAGTKCDDGNPCNGISVCEGTVCKAGTPLSCDDNEVCTNDSCDPVTGCTYVNNTVGCSDNKLCTTNDKCSAGTCKGGAPPNCDDNEACTTDSCDNAKGCQNTAVMDNGTCNDGNSCTTVDKCVGGKCLGSGGPTCDDAKTCTQNTCDVATQACSNPIEQNGTACAFDKCHNGSTCTAGVCTAGALVNCDDNKPCTTDSCDPATGCKHVALNSGACADGDACTQNDVCKSGVCIGTDVTCGTPKDCRVAGSCNPETGVCNDPSAEDGADCVGGQCQNGQCVLNPIGEGGAGGEPAAAGGEPAAGGVAQGGEPASGGSGGTLAVGGEPGEPNTGGKPPRGGSSSTVGGAADEPENVFVRTPGGCSCGVPGSDDRQGLAWLSGLALAAVAIGRRRRARSRPCSASEG